MKNIILISLALFSCSKENECIDENKININKACVQIYRPVCGCDGETYGNECSAENAGVISWKEGECD